MFPRPLTALALLLALVIPAVAQTSAPQSTLKPEHRYTYTIRKTLSGFDGVREVIPTVSLRTVTLETGAAAGGTIPVRMVIGNEQRDDARAARRDTGVEWTLAFDVRPDGSISGTAVESGEGGLPPAMADAIAIKRLAELLFLGPQLRQMKSPPAIAVGTVTSRTDGSGRVDVGYTVTQPAVESPTAEPVATTVAGEAVYDPAAGVFVERTQRETSEIFIAEDILGEQKRVRMNTVTVWNARVDSR